MGTQELLNSQLLNSQKMGYAKELMTRRPHGQMCKWVPSHGATCLHIVTTKKWRPREITVKCQVRTQALHRGHAQVHNPPNPIQLRTVSLGTRDSRQNLAQIRSFMGHLETCSADMGSAQV